MAKSSMEIVKGKNIIRNMKHINNNVDKILDPIKREMNAYRREHFGDYPGAAHSPPIWESDKQRRAYFASDGFGRGIPTRRTGGYKRKQIVRANRSALEVGIFNEHEAAEFLTGERQTRQHAATGYPRYKDHENPVLERVKPIVSRGFVIEIKKELFKK